MLFNLKNKIILVTGSSSGLGFTMARGLAQEGAIVILNGRDEMKLTNAVQSLQYENLNVEGFAFDVSDSAGVKKK